MTDRDWTDDVVDQFRYAPAGLQSAEDEGRFRDEIKQALQLTLKKGYDKGREVAHAKPWLDPDAELLIVDDVGVAKPATEEYITPAATE